MGSAPPSAGGLIRGQAQKSSRLEEEMENSGPDLLAVGYAVACTLAYLGLGVYLANKGRKKRDATTRNIGILLLLIGIVLSAYYFGTWVSLDGVLETMKNLPSPTTPVSPGG